MYQTFYNLKAKPFHLSPDPRFFFGSSGHKRVLAYLRYGINQGEGFIVVTGEVGTGKTTLLRTLLSELPSEKNIVAAQLVTTQLESDELLKMVAASFGLAYEGRSKAALLEELERFFMASAREGRRVLLIVDEAQNLPTHSLEELRMLSNYQVGSKSLFQSFLVGQVEFRDTLRSPNLEQLRQRVIASYHLGPMDLNETRAYVEHRLGLVGWEEDPSFTAEAYAAIYDYTKGVPRRINTLCDRVLLVGYLDELHEITAETVANVFEELREETTEPNDESVVSKDEFASNAEQWKTADDERLASLERRVEELEQWVRGARSSLKELVSNLN
jgi:general secretion pathway protein A